MTGSKPTLYRWSERALLTAMTGAGAVHTGVWLGLLDRHDLHAVDQDTYERRANYRSDGHNERGLWPWEAAALEAHFPTAGRLLVTAAGGGREVVALARRGHEVVGYECNPALVAFGQDLLARRGLAPGASLLPIGRDEAPAGGGPYDGVVVGWSSYCMVIGRERRVAFLRGIRELVPAGAPVLVSFFGREAQARRARTVARVAGALRRARRAPAVELGDDLVPTFVHRFVEDEVAAELRAGGFEPVRYELQGPGPYDSGWAVGVAR